MRITVTDFTEREIKTLNKSLCVWEFFNSPVKVGAIQIFNVSEITAVSGRNSTEKALLHLLNCDGNRLSQIAVGESHIVVFNISDGGELSISVVNPTLPQWSPGRPAL